MLNLKKYLNKTSRKFAALINTTCKKDLEEKFHYKCVNPFYKSVRNKLRTAEEHKDVYIHTPPSALPPQPQLQNNRD